MAPCRRRSARYGLLLVIAFAAMACEENKSAPATARSGFTPVGAVPLPSVRDERSDVVFVQIPAGEYRMGGAARDELPRHRVRLSAPFWLAATEVTSAQWQRFAAAGVAPSVPLPPEGDAAPIQVSCDDAAAYCRHFGYQLPTEAQWEWAARAGDDTVWEHLDLEAFARQAWFHRNAGRQPMPVATRTANAFGLHDMLGNVWEWCADVYAPVYDDPGLAVDPVGPAVGDRRVLRGGSWFSLPPALPWTRASEPPALRTSYFGFRPVCPAALLAR